MASVSIANKFGHGPPLPLGTGVHATTNLHRAEDFRRPSLAVLRTGASLLVVLVCLQRHSVLPLSVSSSRSHRIFSDVPSSRSPSTWPTLPTKRLCHHSISRGGGCPFPHFFECTHDVVACGRLQVHLAVES
uniref:Uncharacterized protein n=1 Tax=Ixodes ricinus TaxID=34613 RepID=A0A0K8R5J9_IXORI